MATSMKASTHIVFLALIVAPVLAPPAASAQIELTQPTATFPEDFGAIQTVRELADGRVLVADPLSKALYAVDMDAGTRTVIGGEGEGPEEYRQPDAVWPLPGDSTLLVDLGNGRLVALGPDLGFGPTWPMTIGDFQPGQPLVLAIPQGVDADGNLFIREMGGGMGGSLPDSANILRIDRATQATAKVGTFKLQDMTQTTSGGANNQNVSISPIPLSYEDAWGIAPDGSVVVVRSGDFHLERIAPDGSVTSGPTIPFDPVGIGTPEKEEYVAELGRSGGGIRVGVSMVNGEMSMSFARGGGGSDREIDQYTWPEEKPPIYSGRIPIDPTGRAWVRRHVEAGEASTYDIFDLTGSVVGSVELGHGKRVIGFGNNSVYVVSYDQFDLNYLERYDMPSF
jgi:hypothetical protein